MVEATIEAGRDNDLFKSISINLLKKHATRIEQRQQALPSSDTNPANLQDTGRAASI